MKRFLRLICLCAVTALLPAALLVSRGLPADAHPYVEKKYAGWSGVLRAWVCAQWECSGSFMRWLNTCAADFEKQHDGVYIEFTPVSSAALRDLGGSGLRPPEMVLFSPGALGDASALARVDAPDSLRNELRDFGGGFAYPVAMGGYVWAYNRTLTDGVPDSGGDFAVLPDDEARSFAAAAVALLSGEPGAEPGEAPEAKPGLDLGLPASAEAEASAALIAEDAFDRFIAGELPAAVLSQAELARLVRLRDAGRGPDWACAAAGQVAYTDQLLLLGLPAQDGEGAQERRALAEAFGASLLSDEAQERLRDIGAFGVTGRCIYPDLSAYAELDGLLNSRELLTPAGAWTNPAACGDLLRALAGGALDPNQALEELRARLKATPHKTAARQAMPFPPAAACKFLDLHPVSLRNLQLHLTKNSFACRPPYLRGVALSKNFVEMLALL